MHLPMTNREVDAPKDVRVLALDAGVKVLDLQQVFSHSVSSNAMQSP